MDAAAADERATHEAERKLVRAEAQRRRDAMVAQILARYTRTLISGLRCHLADV